MPILLLFLRWFRCNRTLRSCLSACWFISAYSISSIIVLLSLVLFLNYLCTSLTLNYLTVYCFLMFKPGLDYTLEKLYSHFSLIIRVTYSLWVNFSLFSRGFSLREMNHLSFFVWKITYLLCLLWDIYQRINPLFFFLAHFWILVIFSI